MNKITGILMSADEIYPGLKSFTEEDGSTYAETMGDFYAGIRVTLEPYGFSATSYDYKIIANGQCTTWGVKRSWLKDFHTEIDWEAVPVDTKVIIHVPDHPPLGRHFSHYDKESGTVYVYAAGRTSWTEVSYKDKYISQYVHLRVSDK